MVIYKHFILIFIILLHSSQSFSQQSHKEDRDQQNPVAEQIRELAKEALEKKATKLVELLDASRYTVKTGKLPRGLSFTPCQHTPIVEFVSDDQPGEQRMQIYCEQPAHWSVYYRGQIDLFLPVITSRRTMTAGETPSSKDFNVQIRNISELKRGYLTHFNQLAGKQISKRIRGGEVVTPAMVKPAWLVKRGEQVILRVYENSFEIKMPGKALANGTLGDQVRVQNLSSGKIIRGIISGNNQVDIL